MGSGAVEIDRSGLYVERAVDDLVGSVELHLDVAGIGVDGEGLMLGECGWSEYEREDYDCEGFHCITSPKRFNCRELFWRASISVGERLWSNSGGLSDTRESSRYAHRAGPDPQAERQYSARECVV
jgi:hypothetical protein